MKTNNQNQTTVIFRKYRNGEIIALFPEEAWSYTTCASYMHIGQHGGADYAGTIQSTRPATEAEYADLLQELQSIGYDLRVLKRKPTARPTDQHKRLANDIESAANSLDWKCTIEKHGNEYLAEFENMTDGGQDLIVSVWSKTLTGIFDAIYDYYLGYDPDYEASLWIGDDGHGINGAPYDLQDLLEDMKAAKSMIYDLYNTVKHATWAAA